MIPTQIDVGHYRALRGIGVPIGNYTALVGPNGVGKSTVLDALDFFLTGNRGIDEADLQRGCDEPVSVTVTLSHLSDGERLQYEDFLNDAGDLVVTKVCRPGDGARYEVLGVRHLAFDEIRELAHSSKTAFNTAFKSFAQNERYDLKPGRSASENLAELRRWETDHPNECVEAQVPFEFIGSTKDQLILSTRYVYVPAVQEASDTLGATRSPLSQMLDALVYPRFEANEEFLQLRTHVEDEYRRLFPPEGTPELADLARRITDALETFCPGTAVALGWAEYKAPLRVPSVVPEVIEDGIGTNVDRKGHGLQRALIIAMLQAEDEHRRATEDDESGDVHVILMIEEPELYQHPTQCRHFRRVLTNLSAAKEGAGIRVLVTTHSPDFISLDGIDAIRIMRRESAATGVPARKISAIALDEIAQRYAEITEKPVDAQQLFRQLHIVDGIMREAFFANAAILVEGVGDHGLIAAQCAIDDVDLEGKGIVIIPCGGKTNIALPVCILRLLGVKHYAVFDSDVDSAQNRPVLKALGVAESAIPSSGTPQTAICDTYAVLKPRIEGVVRTELGGAAFDEAAQLVAEEFGRAPDQLLKNPVTARRLLEVLRDKGLVCESLRKIVIKIAAL